MRGDALGGGPFGLYFSRGGCRCSLARSADATDANCPPRPFAAAFAASCSRFARIFCWNASRSASASSSASRAARSRSRSFCARRAAILEISASRFSRCAESARAGVGFAGRRARSGSITNGSDPSLPIACELYEDRVAALRGARRALGRSRETPGASGGA